MIFRSFLAASLLGSLSIVPSAPSQRVATDGASQTFAYLTDQYLEQVYFKFSPTAGTGAGLHQYDSQLEDYSAAGIQREVAALRTYEKKLAAIDPKALDAGPAADY